MSSYCKAFPCDHRSSTTESPHVTQTIIWSSITILDPPQAIHATRLPLPFFPSLQETQKKKRKRGHVTLKRTAFAFKNPSSFRTDLELEPKAHPPRHHFKAGCRGVHCTDSSRHPPSHTLATSSELGLTASKTALQAGMNIAATFSASMLESPCGRLRPSATL